MKQNQPLLVVLFTIFASACSPSAVSQGPAETVIPTSTEAPATATATRTPKPATQTPTSTPGFDLSATAIVDAVMTASPPRLHGSYLSPDEQWRVEVIIYNCV